MFGRRKIVAPQKIETLIGKETIINGALESGGSIRIEGSFQGDIIVQNDTIIGEAALVQAHIRCANLVLAGRVEGNVYTRGKLDIRATGVLIGDAEVASLVVEDGAVLAGRCNMKVREDKRIPDGKIEKLTALNDPEEQEKRNSLEKPDGKDKVISEHSDKEYASAGKSRGKKR